MVVARIGLRNFGRHLPRTSAKTHSKKTSTPKAISVIKRPQRGSTTVSTSTWRCAGPHSEGCGEALSTGLEGMDGAVTIEPTGLLSEESQQQLSDIRHEAFLVPNLGPDPPSEYDHDCEYVAPFRDYYFEVATALGLPVLDSRSILARRMQAYGLLARNDLITGNAPLSSYAHYGGGTRSPADRECFASGVAGYRKIKFYAVLNHVLAPCCHRRINRNASGHRAPDRQYRGATTSRPGDRSSPRNSGTSGRGDGIPASG